ncbi:hypothetical protein GWK47_011253 [Chionoecetes opilio]|uniref:Transposase IS30-like HTH domain-containing protein n=1 Tax=Chionoecetes opilio TaxID=41210 RepID=A0A8J4Y0I9_CHIOP|nr:hypothetical protein GWK47_011253 [Chionoecetes opilio]
MLLADLCHLFDWLWTVFPLFCLQNLRQALRMENKRFTIEEKARILALREEKVSMKEISERMGRTEAAFFALIKQASDLPAGVIPATHQVSGCPCKTTKATDLIEEIEVVFLGVGDYLSASLKSADQICTVLKL